MITKDFLRGRRRSELSSADLQVVEDSVVEIRDIPARRTILKTGEKPKFSIYLIEGIICRYMVGRDGERQLVALQVPGDFVDLHAFPLPYLDHDNATASPCQVGIVPHERLEEIQRDLPALTKMLWFSTLLDAAMHREWIFRLGRLSAIGRVAHFFAETEYRLAMLGRVSATGFALPLVQADLAEACGLTAVHINRTLQKLRADQVMEFREGSAIIFDRETLWELSEFSPSYLFGDAPVIFS